MKISIDSFGSITRLFPEKYEIYEGASVKDLLDDLREKTDYPQFESLFYTNDGNIRDDVIISINDVSITAFNNEDTELHEGDAVFIAQLDVLGG